MTREFQTIDAHAGGCPVRLVVAGGVQPTGLTMPKRQAWMARRAEALRRALVLPPRGQADLCGALLTSPVSSTADAGLLFFDADGFTALHLTAVMAIATIAAERGLIVRGDPAPGEPLTLTFDTAAGQVQARLRTGAGAGGVSGGGTRVTGVTVCGVPSFVAGGSVPVTLGSRVLRVDFAFGGAFQAMVDAESTGIPLDAAHLPELRRLAVDICEAVNGSHPPVHPTGATLNGLGGVVFTGPPEHPSAHLRTLAISSSGVVDRSASATGTAAMMAVLEAMGLLHEGDPFVHEGLLGTTLEGRIGRRLQVGEVPAFVPEIDGRAWITGDHTFVVDDADPLADGYRL